MKTLLYNEITRYFSHFPKETDVYYEQYQKATESLLLLIIQLKEKKTDEFIHKAGQFIEQSFQLILDLLGITPFNKLNQPITSNDRYLALIKRSLINNQPLLVDYIKLARCIYKIRSRFEHILKKIENNTTFLAFVLIVLFLIQISLDDLLSSQNTQIDSKIAADIQRNILSYSFEIGRAHV